MIDRTPVGNLVARSRRFGLAALLVGVAPLGWPNQHVVLIENRGSDVATTLIREPATGTVATLTIPAGGTVVVNVRSSSDSGLAVCSHGKCVESYWPGWDASWDVVVLTGPTVMRASSIHGPRFFGTAAAFSFMAWLKEEGGGHRSVTLRSAAHWWFPVRGAR